MTNFEKYKDEILEVIKQGDNPALKNGVITPCNTTNCMECEFYTGYGCIKKFIKWLYVEAKPTLTAKERAFCEMVTEGYIARDEDGELYIYANEPLKEKVGWSYDADYLILNSEYFPFIKWEDESPWSIEELLKLEVEDDKD